MNRHTAPRARWRLPYLVGVIALSAPMIFPSLPAVADDGSMVRKEVVKTPDLESDHAQLSMMQFFVPATSASGELTETQLISRSE